MFITVLGEGDGWCMRAPWPYSIKHSVFFKMQISTFGCAGSSWLCRRSLVVASGSCFLVAVLGLLFAVSSVGAEHRL